MKTYLDCIPCFFKQALDAARIAGANESTQKKILNRLAKTIQKLPLSSSPPEMGRTIYKLIKELTKIDDPYSEIKTENNRLALKFYPNLKKRVSYSKDSLLAALELAIAGNIIDYGAKNSLNVDKRLKEILHDEENAIKKEDKAIFDYMQFKNSLKKSNSILYLADNAGETVFDRILIEEINSIYSDKETIYAVKEKPIINDALIQDAYICGIDKVAEVISCGSDGPGTILSLCSKKFLKIYKRADIIISKGQGNYEALSGEKRPIFFLFMAKCPVIAKDVACNVGDIILMKNSSRKRRAYYRG